MKLALWKYPVHSVAYGFATYRLFDIWKPFPIRHVEQLPGGWGIMADDVVAGAYTLVLLHLAHWALRRLS